MSQVQWDESRLSELEQVLIPRAGRRGKRDPEDTPEERIRLKGIIRQELGKYGFVGDVFTVDGSWRYSASNRGEIRRNNASNKQMYGGRLVRLEKIPFPVLKRLADAAKQSRVSIDTKIEDALRAVPDLALSAGFSGKTGIDLLKEIVSEAEESLAKGVLSLRTVHGVELKVSIPLPYDKPNNSIMVCVTTKSASVVICKETSVYNVTALDSFIRTVVNIKDTCSLVNKVIKVLKLNKEKG